MNKTQQLLKEREEEFDRKFIAYNYNEDIQTLIGNPNEIKSFHATTISLLLNSIKEEIDGKRSDFKGGGVGKDTDIFMSGYNSALSDISTLLSETISTLTKEK